MVQDPWGAALTVATVEAKNVATGSVSKAASNAAGKYTLADLAPGVYDISVAVPAVRPFEKKGVTVAAAKTLELNIKLQEGTQLSTLGEDTLGNHRGSQAAQPAVRTDAANRRRQARSLGNVVVADSDHDPGKPEWLPEAQAVGQAAAR